MKPHIITNFTDSFTSYFDSSIMRIAREKGLFDPQFYNLGDYSLQAQHRVDDKPYGGGAGALIQIEPMYRAITSIEASVQAKVESEKVKGMDYNKKNLSPSTLTIPPSTSLRKIYLGPRGKRFVQSDAEKLSTELADKEFIILCGHYEGVDHRVFEMFEFEQYSIGDFVISSGELATMVLLDSIVRLIPGVVGNKDSLHEESFSEALGGKPEYPQYTRPADFMGFKVPEVLLSGDPKKVKAWREKS